LFISFGKQINLTVNRKITTDAVDTQSLCVYLWRFKCYVCVCACVCVWGKTKASTDPMQYMYVCVKGCIAGDKKHFLCLWPELIIW